MLASSWPRSIGTHFAIGNMASRLCIAGSNIALNLLWDTALSVQFEALIDSRFEPIHYKVRKLLDEERFHFDHGQGWAFALVAARRDARRSRMPSERHGTPVCARSGRLMMIR